MSVAGRPGAKAALPLDPKERAASVGRFRDALLFDAELWPPDSKDGKPGTPVLSPHAKIVGFAILAHVNSRSGKSWPSLSTLAALLHMSRATVKVSIGALVKARWFLKSAGGGRASNRYEINPDRVPDESPISGPDIGPLRAQGVDSIEDQTPGPGGQQMAPRGPANGPQGASKWPAGGQQMAPNLPIEPADRTDSPPAPNGASPPKPNRGTRIAESWQPSPADRAFATKEGFTDDEIERIAAKFRNHWLSTDKNPVKRDWAATWRNWVMRDRDGTADRGSRRNGPPARPDGQGPASIAGAARRLFDHGR